MHKAAANLGSTASRPRRVQRALHRRAVNVAILLACLLLAARTFLVQGLFVPVRIAGPSMAPTLVGVHWNVRCAACQKAVRIGSEAKGAGGGLPCPACGAPLPLGGARLIPGDRVFLDRATYRFRGPRRFELVAFKAPDEAGKLAVKRVVGLPGEAVSLQRGDLWINGQRFQKSAAEMRAQAIFVGELELAPEAMGANAARFVLGPAGSSAASGPITDDLPYNGALPHRLAQVSDLAIEARLSWSGPGRIELRLPGAQRPWRAVLDLSKGKSWLYSGELPVDEAALPVGGAPVDLWFGHWDGRCELWAGGQRILAAPQSAALLPQGETTGVPELQVGLNVAVEGARLWRDLYLTSAPDGRPPTADAWTVGPDEFFVVGDNLAVSEDSRTWKRAGLPRGAMVGRPVKWTW